MTATKRALKPRGGRLKLFWRKILKRRFWCCLADRPGRFLKKNGAESYNHCAEALWPYLQFVLDNVARERKLNSPKAKAEAVEEILPVLSSIRNLIERRETLKQTLRFFQIDDKVTENYLWKEIQKNEKDFGKRDGAITRKKTGST
jgi:DNA primase